MMERTFFVRLNLDDFTAEMTGLDSTEERGEWIEGFQVGCHGHPARPAWSEVKRRGHEFGVASLHEAEGARLKFSMAGQRSAESRKSKIGTAQPLKPSNDVRTSLRTMSRTSPEHTVEHPLEHFSNQPTTNNQQPITTSQQPAASSQQSPSRKMRGGAGEFTPPTLDDWQAYCAATWPDWHPSRSQEAWEYYEGAKWRIGKAKKKAEDWKACASTAHKNAKEWGTLQPKMIPPTRQEYFAFAHEMAIRTIPFPEDPQYQWPQERWAESYNRHEARKWQGIADWKAILKADCQQWVSREIENRKRPSR